MVKTNTQAVPLQAQRDWRPVARRLRQILLIVAVLAFGAWCGQRLRQAEFLPINKIRAQGEFKHVTEAMLQGVLHDMQGGYFSIRVGQIQQAIEALAWVDRASVRRVWPDTLRVGLIEQQPLAYWQGGGLVNVRGEVFKPDLEHFSAPLPILSGPAGTSKTLSDHYRIMNQQLAALGIQILRIDMDARRALVLRLDNGMRLQLGRRDKQVRLSRFIQAYPKLLQKNAAHIAQVDMRYSNGFSVLRKQ